MSGHEVSGLLETCAADIVTLIMIGVLACAAMSDLATRTIPDLACVTLAILGVGLRLSAGLPALGWSVAVAALLFGLLVFAHARGALGGGDVKLAAAMALGLAPLETWRFVVATILAGGVLSIVHLVLRHAAAPSPTCRTASLPRRVAAIERWRIRRKGSLPYGIAIACGGVWVSLTGMGT
jgi:prepilin peptidase CpaA